MPHFLRLVGRQNGVFLQLQRRSNRRERRSREASELTAGLEIMCRHAGSLCCFIVIKVISASNFFIFTSTKPTNAVTKLGGMNFIKYVCICNDAPDMNSFIIAKLDVGDFFITDKIIHNGTNFDILVRAKQHRVFSCFMNGKYEISWQRKGQYLGSCPVGHFVRRSMSSVEQFWLNFKLKPLFSFLIDSVSNRHNEISPHLLGSNFSDRCDIFSATSCELFHCSRRPSSFSNGSLHFV